MTWSMLSTRAIVCACIGPVAVFGVIGIAAQDVGYLIPTLVAAAPAWIAAIAQLVIHRRAVRSLSRGWN